jgi:hypothetical protein
MEAYCGFSPMLSGDNNMVMNIFAVGAVHILKLKELRQRPSNFSTS